MRALIKMLAAAVVLAMNNGTAFAVMGKTTTDVALRTAPAARADVILNLSEGAISGVGSGRRPLFSEAVSEMPPSLARLSL